MTLTKQENEAILVLATFGENCDAQCHSCQFGQYENPCLPMLAYLMKKRLDL